MENAFQTTNWKCRKTVFDLIGIKITQDLPQVTYFPGLETTRHPVFSQKGIVLSDFGSSFRNILIL